MTVAPAVGRWRIANLIAQLAFGLVAMTICLPSMPSWVDAFGASTAAVQLTFSAYVVAFGVLQLLYGPLSDRLGRRRVLLAGLVVAGAGSAAAMLAPDLPTLVAARALQGAGCAAGMVVGRALVQDLFQGAERTRVMAFVGMAMGLCPPTAILLGGQLHVRLGWQANFALVAGLAALLAVAAWRGLPASRPASATPGTSAPVPWARAMAQAYARLARERNFVLYVFILAMATATFYAFLAGAPLVLLGIGHGLLMPPTLSGTVGVIPALAGSAAAVGGLMQQLLGAVGGYAVGWVRHDSAFGVGALMLGFMLLALLAQVALHRRRVGAPASRGAGAEP